MTVPSLQYPLRAGNETFPFQLLPASFPASHVAGTTKCVLRLLESRIFSCPLTVPQTEVNLAQMRQQGCAVSASPQCQLPVQLLDVSSSGCSGPSGSSLGCSLSIPSAPGSAAAWLQGFTPHFESSQLSCSFHGGFPTRPGFDVCFP